MKKQLLILLACLGSIISQAQYQRGIVQEDGRLSVVPTTIQATIESRDGSPTVMEGFPKAMLANSTFKNFRNVTLADLNDDGADEVIIGVNDKLYAYDSNGLLWEKDIIGTALYPPSVADMDGDGDLEIVLATGGLTSGRLYVVDHTSTDLPNFPLNFDDHWMIAAPALSDLDEDGQLEIIVGERTPPIGRLQIIKLDGTSFSNFPVEIDGTPALTPSVADIDNDGEKDIVIASTSSLYAFDLKGVIKIGFPIQKTGLKYSYQSPILIDLDQDGTKEIVGAGHGDAPEYYIRNSVGNYKEGWAIPIPENTWSFNTPTVIDWNNETIIFMSRPVGSDNDEDMLYAWNSRGELLSNFPIIKAGGLEGIISVADIDNDLEPELVFGSNLYDPTSGRSFIHAYNLDGTIVSGFPIRPKGWTFMNGVTIGDVNGDGKMDMATLSYTQNFGATLDSTYLTVYELEVPYSPDRVWWSTYKGSNDRAGAIESATISSTASIAQSTVFKLFPNPASTQISIETAQQEYNLRLTDFYGRIVLDLGYVDTINLDDFTAGLYFLSFLKEGKVLQTERIIITK